MATDVLITPSSGIIEFNNGVQGSLLGTLATMRVYDSLTTGNLSIQNSTTGANLSGVRFINRGVTGNIFEVYGTFGNLLTIDDDLNDSIFSINGSAGLPVFDVYSNNSIYAGQYGSGDFTITGNNIGIGINTPSGKLHIRGSKTTDKIILGTYNTNYNVKIESGDQLNFYQGTTATPGYINYSGGDTNLSQNLYIEKATGATTGLVRINANGNVGINTASPARPLTVNGDGTNPCIRLINSTFATSANTALYTFRGWLPIDIGTTKYYLQVFN